MQPGLVEVLVEGLQRIECCQKTSWNYFRAQSLL